MEKYRSPGMDLVYRKMALLYLITFLSTVVELVGV
jgi:hypothetical protein